MILGAVHADVDILARTVYGEARGESIDGAVAVAWVVANRVKAGIRGSTVREVCLAPAQFSAWNRDDPNLVRIACASIDPAFERACAIATAVLAGILPDPTGAATDYHTIAKPAGASAWPPSWAAAYIPTVRIGAHQFYRRPQ